MDTRQTEFITRRQAAHVAGTQGIAQDPLVQAAMQAQRHAVEVMARWKALRLQAVPVMTSSVHAFGQMRRQAE